jgi:hypothetical protein
MLSGALGGLIGTLISSLIGYSIFRRQFIIDSNRQILEDMYRKIRSIYLLIQQNRAVSDEDLNYLVSFKVIGLKEFEKLNKNLMVVQKAILSYNEGVRQTLQTTTTSTLQVTSKSEAESAINELIKTMRTMS